DEHRDVGKRTELVRVRDRVLAKYTFAVGLDHRDRVKASVEILGEARLAVHADDLALRTAAASPGDRVKEPRDTLGAVERPQRRVSLAAAVRDQRGVGREQRHERFPVSIARRRDESAQHLYTRLVVDDKAPALR